MIRRSSEVTILYILLVRPDLEYYIQMWSPQYRKDMGLLELTQRRATKMIQEMDHFPYKDRLRAGAVQPGEEKALGRPESGLSLSKRGATGKKAMADTLAGSVVAGQWEIVSN
mgnify:CR=1 FL=1